MRPLRIPSAPRGQRDEARAGPAQRHRAGLPGTASMAALQAAVQGSPRLQPQRALQRMADAATAQRVIQREKKTVDGVEVDVGGGYTNWEGWHINWRLGSKKGGREQYHLTSQDRTQHYFFVLGTDGPEDTKPPAKLVPKGISGGISKAPSEVRDFVMRNYRDLM